MTIFEWVFVILSFWNLGGRWFLQLVDDDPVWCCFWPGLGLIFISWEFFGILFYGCNKYVSVLWCHCFCILHLLQLYLLLWGKLAHFWSLFHGLWLDFLIQMRIWIFLENIFVVDWNNVGFCLLFLVTSKVCCFPQLWNQGDHLLLHFAWCLCNLVYLWLNSATNSCIFISGDLFYDLKIHRSRNFLCLLFL